MNGARLADWLLRLDWFMVVRRIAFGSVKVAIALAKGFWDIYDFILTG